MKKLATFLTVLPGISFAHGGHPPLPEAAHSLTHLGPVLGFGLICVVVGVVLHRRWTS